MIKTYLPKKFKNILFLNISLSWITGICFFILSTWFTIDGEFGPESHPMQFPTLQLHAASAFLIMMLFGALVFSHLPNAWQQKRSRITGISLAIWVGIQIITAYCLYYLSNELAREIIEYIHLITGGCLPVIIFFHVTLGKKNRITAAITSN